jgi:hypothetical protein
MQYRGKQWYGVFYGISTQNKREHFMIRASGDRADELCAAVAESENCSPRCTRIDLQVTIPLPKNYSAYKLADALRKSEWKGREREITLIESGDGLDTVYIGHRTSEDYTRIYVKEAISRYLRYEVEFKGDKAAQVFTRVCLGGRAAIGSVLLSQFAKMPVTGTVGQTCLGEFLKDFDYRPLRAVERVTDPSSTMRWMEDSVSPAIYRMLNDSENSDRMGQMIMEWFEYAVEHDKLGLHE